MKAILLSLTFLASMRKFRADSKKLSLIWVWLSETCTLTSGAGQPLTRLSGACGFSKEQSFTYCAMISIPAAFGTAVGAATAELSFLSFLSAIILVSFYCYGEFAKKYQHCQAKQYFHIISEVF